MRQSQAGDLFLGAYLPNSETHQLIGYVCGTSSPAQSLTHTSMYTHIPNSPSVCIHSVCVSPPHRRKGVGVALLREFVKRLEGGASHNYERVLLITHEELRLFYEAAGFEWV